LSPFTQAFALNRLSDPFFLLKTFRPLRKELHRSK